MPPLALVAKIGAWLKMLNGRQSFKIHNVGTGTSPGVYRRSVYHYYVECHCLRRHDVHHLRGAGSLVR